MKNLCSRGYTGLFGIAFLVIISTPLPAQTGDNPRNEQRIYDDDILAVQLHLQGAPLTFPMVDLNAGIGTLVLEFDHLGAELREYEYTLQHCNADWQPSDLVDNQYITGFTEDRLTDSYNSLNTIQQYVHYTLTLPNANMRWTKSGNYLLKVYDNTGEKYLALVRRFVVVERQWDISTDFVKPVGIDKLNTHQEIDFSISTKNAHISYPQKEVKAYILQNGRWDKIIGPLPPYVVRGDQLVYDYQDKIVFPGGKEWRYFDLRTFEYRGEYVKDIVNRSNYYEVTLNTDESRGNRSYVYHGDLNGRFSIENLNNNQGLNECDYAEVLFSLKQNIPFDDADVYVFGELSDWQIKPEFKMRFAPEVGAYVCTPYLKQGYYNYEYVVVDRKTGQVDDEALEGNSYETGNTYQILVYYRPFGERYDHLVVTASMDSRIK